MIRLAQPDDLPSILQVYEIARRFMAQTGNPNQWKTSHPAQSILEADIAAQRLYVRDNNGVHGSFALFLEPDPTYSRIYGGAWRSELPYGTIHRIASDGSKPGFLEEAVAFCRMKNPHLRIDTHEDNKVMQHLVVKNGFEYCGIIYLENGDPRLAYELL